MTILNRRRFITISAGAVIGTALTALPARAAAYHQWRGVALGADASITLAHPEAEAVVARALAEIARLEAIFSLYRSDSALARLNADGTLENPPFEMLECLAQARAVHGATGGKFDPTIQPLWALYAERHASGHAPSAEERAVVLERIGMQHVQFDALAVRFSRAGMALSLNGIAQGYIADRVADMLRAEGLRDVLVNTGEYHALGGRPDGAGAWPVTLDDGQRRFVDAVHLQDRALASSAPNGTVFDAAGQVGHILDPQSGLPAPMHWHLVSVTARRAALADALSTAFCLMNPEAMAETLRSFPDAELVHLG